MPARTKESDFQASLWGLPGETSTALLGFAISANMADGRSRSTWAELVGTHRSYLTEMTRTPSRPFIRKFAGQLARIPSQQRLRPDLWTLYGDLFPHSAEEDVTGWLARNFDIRKDGRTTVANVLSRAEIAIAKCRSVDEDDIKDVTNHLFVRDTLDDLLILASGPYGGSHLAIQKAVELGLLAPYPFFELTRIHLYESPVGFRLLRMLERMAQVIDDEEQTKDLETESRPERLLRELLTDLYNDKYMDWYPSGEWGVGLARSRLRKGKPISYKYLLRIASDGDSDKARIGGSVHARIGAVWALVEGGRQIGGRQVPQHIGKALSSIKNDSADIGSDVIDRLIPLLELRRKGVLSDEDVVIDSELNQLIKDFVYKTSVGDGVRDSLLSVVIAILSTPALRYRRNLVEAVPAANLVIPVIEVLLKVWDATTDPFIQESVLFALSRLRESDPRVIRLFLSLMDSPNPHLAQLALWGIGDTFDPDRTGAALAEEMPNRLAAVALRAESDKSPTVIGVRLAAAHALAVMAKNPSALNSLKKVAELDDVVGRMAKWGQAMAPTTFLVDPVSLKPKPQSGT